MDDFKYLTWMARNLKIINLDGEEVSLIANVAQRQVHGALQKQHESGLPVRAIVLKARREGVSTYVQGRYFADVNRRKNQVACIISADEDATNKVFKMSQYFQGHYTNKRKTKHSNRKEIIYDKPHYSEFVCQTAGKGILGRGGRTSHMHATEFAFWANAKSQFGGAAQEVPDRHGTSIIIESTANGVGDAFYDMFWQAWNDWKETKDLNNYLPIFLPWYIFPEYVKTPPEGYKLEEEEIFLKNKFKLTDNQIYWRRWAIKNKCQGDIGLFKQEYPSTALEAFQSAGTPVFPAGILNDQEKKLTDKGRYGIFVKDGDVIKFEPTEQQINCWFMAEPVEKDGIYCAGADTMEGRSVDPKDEKAKTDYHGVATFRRDTGKFVCAFKGRCEQIELAEQYLLMARYYNNAYLAPEIPNGMIVLQYLKDRGYDKIYNRQVHDEHLTVEESENLGWRTTSITRKWLVDDLITCMRDGDVTINLPWILEEMKTFIRDKTGKPIHNTGKHDDVLFGAMISIQIHKRCPMDSMVYPYAETGEWDEPGTDNYNELAYIGRRDTWQPT